MATGKINFGANIGSVSRTTTISRSGTVFVDDVTPAAGKSGTITTRTDADTGVLTLTSHGITDSDVVDVGWVDASGDNKRRFRMTVSSYDTDTLTVDGGTGDDFPAQDYAVVCGKRTALDFACTGSTMAMISIGADAPTGETDSRCVVDFVTSGGTTIKGCDVPSQETFCWVDNGPIANPLAGQTVGAIEVSSLTTQSPQVNIELVYSAG